MKTIGIKLADGSFYPILEEGIPKKRILDLTTVKDNQTTVQIDLYRSDTGSMEDAEYVDTLQVTKLNPHPNGEPDLHLSVGLDENNELSAEVVDSETGIKSETQVQLVSRTLAERENPTNFEVTDDSNFSLPENAIDDSELAVLEAENVHADAKKQTSPAAAPAGEDEPKDAVAEDFSFDDLVDDTFAKQEEKEKTGDTAADTAKDKKIPEPAEVPFSFDSEIVPAETEDEEKTVAEETPDEEPAAVAEEKTDIFEEPEVVDDQIPVDEPENIAEESVEEPAGLESDAAKTEETNSSTDTITEEKFELPDFDETFNITDDETKQDEKNESAKSEASSDFAAVTSDTETSADKTESSSSFTETDFTVPDFDNPSLSDGENTLTPKTEGLSGYFDDPAFKDPVFNEPDLNSKNDISSDFSAIKEEEKKSYTASAPNMDFSSLYDKETIAGEHATAEQENEDVKKKTRAPVLICIICAIICIIATILVLFVVPSKYNLIKSRNPKFRQETEVAKAAPVEETPAPAEPAPVEAVPAPEPDPAPVVPEPLPPPAKKENIRYHIKWGDTLWDIADAYYKNPWRYHKLAKFNHIKNPDLIISGTYITIPAE
jgi:hypothetical protein